MRNVLVPAAVSTVGTARPCRQELQNEGLPSFVAGWCSLAHDRSLQRGYRDVGYLLASRITGFRPANLTSSQWRTTVAVLRSQVHGKNRPAVRQWCLENYPSLMALIPARQHSSFLAGLVEQIQRERSQQNSSESTP